MPFKFTGRMSAWCVDQGLKTRIPFSKLYINNDQQFEKYSHIFGIQAKQFNYLHRCISQTLVCSSIERLILQQIAFFTLIFGPVLQHTVYMSTHETQKYACCSTLQLRKECMFHCYILSYPQSVTRKFGRKISKFRVLLVTDKREEITSSDKLLRFSCSTALQLTLTSLQEIAKITYTLFPYLIREKNMRSFASQGQTWNATNSRKFCFCCYGCCCFCFVFVLSRVRTYPDGRKVVVMHVAWISAMHIAEGNQACAHIYIHGLSVFVRMSCLSRIMQQRM